MLSWGDAAAGGNSSAVANQLRSGVTRLFANDYAFAAFNSDGSVVPWGSANLGGKATIDADPNRSVASQLSAGVVEIFSTTAAFSALKSDGPVVSWGDSLYGGDSAPSPTSSAPECSRSRIPFTTIDASPPPTEPARSALMASTSAMAGEPWPPQAGVMAMAFTGTIAAAAKPCAGSSTASGLQQRHVLISIPADQRGGSSQL